MMTMTSHPQGSRDENWNGVSCLNLLFFHRHRLGKRGQKRRSHLSIPIYIDRTKFHNFNEGLANLQFSLSLLDYMFKDN